MKRGRPKLKASEKREVVPVRLSPKELKAMNFALDTYYEAARRVDPTIKKETLSAWMRRTLLNAVPVQE